MKKSIQFLILEIFMLMILIRFSNAFIIGLTFIFIHELVHILVAKLYGVKLNKLSVGISGATAGFLDFEDIKDFKKFVVYLSGPLFNLIVGIFFYLISLNYNSEFINTIYLTNLGLFIFNLIPAYPLDGSRMMEIILFNLITYRKSKKVIEYTSYFLSAFFIFSFVFLIFIHRINLTLILVGILIFYSAILEKRTTSYIMMNDLIKKRNKIEKLEYLENRSVSVFYKVRLLSLLKMIDKNKFNSFYILDEEVKLIKIIHEDEVIDALKEYGDISIEEYLNS